LIYGGLAAQFPQSRNIPRVLDLRRAGDFGAHAARSPRRAVLRNQNFNHLSAETQETRYQEILLPAATYR
jgi:hypothetical protein